MQDAKFARCPKKQDGGGISRDFRNVSRLVIPRPAIVGETVRDVEEGFPGLPFVVAMTPGGRPTRP